MSDTAVRNRPSLASLSPFDGPTSNSRPSAHDFCEYLEPSRLRQANIALMDITGTGTRAARLSAPLGNEPCCRGLARASLTPLAARDPGGHEQ